MCCLVNSRWDGREDKTVLHCGIKETHYCPPQCSYSGTSGFLGLVRMPAMFATLSEHYFWYEQGSLAPPKSFLLWSQPWNLARFSEFLLMHTGCLGSVPSCRWKNISACKTCDVFYIEHPCRFQLHFTINILYPLLNHIPVHPPTRYPSTYASKFWMQFRVSYKHQGPSL